MEYEIINCPHGGKIIPEYALRGELKRKAMTCPECGSKRNCKSGFRQRRNGKVQCYLCQNCGRRFTGGRGGI